MEPTPPAWFDVFRTASRQPLDQFNDIGGRRRRGNFSCLGGSGASLHAPFSFDWI
jgi:hypothetical protein